MHKKHLLLVGACLLLLAQDEAAVPSYSLSRNACNRQLQLGAMIVVAHVLAVANAETERQAMTGAVQSLISTRTSANRQALAGSAVVSLHSEKLHWPGCHAVPGRKGITWVVRCAALDGKQGAASADWRRDCKADNHARERQ